MPGPFARVLCATALLLMVPAVASHAQKKDAAQMLQLVGDGAADCARAKIAAASRAPHHAAVSLASANFDVTYYHLDLFIGMDDDSITGTVRVEGRVVNAALSTLTLDLAPTMEAVAVTLPDDTPLAFTHPGAALNIQLPSSQGVGSLVAVDITYRGIPLTDGFGNFVFGTRSPGYRYGWSLSEPYGAREWWPCKDHPSDKADSVRVTVTVPSEYRVGSQGLLLSENVNGPNTTYDWLSHYPISSYLISVSVGVYLRFQESYTRPVALEAEFGPLTMPLDHLRYRMDTAADTLPANWQLTPDMMEVEEDWFGPYPFANEKYGHAQFTFFGGMEHQTMTSLGGGGTATVAHEMAHQWYGDSVTPASWRHLWLNEGFATYSELLYFEARPGVIPGAYEALLQSKLASARRAQGTLVLEDTTTVASMFNGDRVYSKGGIVLYMLRYVVGDATFKNIMRAWADDPAVKYGTGTTAGFERVAEQVSGQDLDAFFREWVTQGTGYPTYSATASWKPITGGYHLTVTLTQSQVAPQSNWSVFTMPVEIAVMAQSAGSLTEVHRARVLNNQRLQTFEFDVNVATGVSLTTVRIDPDQRILRGASIKVLTQVPAIPVLTAVAPNPSRNTIQLQYTLGSDSNVDIRIYDVAGRRVLSRKVSAAAGIQFTDIDVSSLASGVYFLRMTTPKGEAKSKFVVVR
ncbi:MAG TPA: M1 family aminopeptidase [Candidatus Krumholzibacteria bacterium]